jgi:threonine dehydrogenase-like Zn-dependent dehydrogenase
VILGHEIVARIAKKGAAVNALELGERVLVAPNLECGVCAPCRKGKPNQCKNGTCIGIFVDGGFARFVKAPQRALHPLREDVPLEEAVWGEILSCALGSTDRIRIQPGQIAVVIGAGPAGMMHALLFEAAGAKAILADMSEERLQFARSAGLQTTVNPKKQNLQNVILELTAEGGADVVVDAVGNQFPTAVDLVAPGGTISLFGINAHAKPAIAQSDITRKELTVLGSFVGTYTFPRAIAVLESRVLNLASLISHDIGVMDLPDAMQAVREGKAMKIMVRPGA